MAGPVMGRGGLPNGVQLEAGSLPRAKPESVIPTRSTTRNSGWSVRSRMSARTTRAPRGTRSKSQTERGLTSYIRTDANARVGDVARHRGKLRLGPGSRPRRRLALDRGRRDDAHLPGARS